MCKFKNILMALGFAAVLTLTGLADDPATRATTQPSTKPVNELAWLSGNWQVTYKDRFLGDVSGWAVVEPSPHDPGQTRISYTIEHPRTKKKYVLYALGVKREDQELVIRFFGPGPSDAITPDGERQAQREAGVTLLEVPEGHRLTATIDGMDATAVVSSEPAIGLSVTLRLKITADKQNLSGTWSSEKHFATGFRGSRIGQKADGKKKLGSAQIDTQYMQGAESWRREGPQIERVTIADMESFGRFAAVRDYFKDKTRLGEAWLRIEGKDLPVKAGQKCEVKFEDPAIRYLDAYKPDPKVAGALQILVELDKSVQPGPKPFMLNGAPGVWSFDFPGLEPSEIRYARQLRVNEYETAAGLVLGEMFYIEVIFPHEPFYKDRQFMTLSSAGGVPAVYKVEKSADQPRVFRSGPILVQDVADQTAAPDALDGGAGDLGVHIGKIRTVRGAAGGMLHTSAADAVRPDSRRRIGSIALTTAGEGRYQKALALAKDLRKRFADDDRYLVSVRIITEGFRKRGNRISVEDHAALILIHEEMRDSLDSYVSAANQPLPPALQGNTPAALEYRAKRLQWMRELMEAARRGDEIPLFLHEVPAPDGKDDVKLSEALSEGFASKAFGSDQQRYFEYVQRSVAFAEGKLIASGAESLAHMRRIDIANPRDLLALARLGYASIAPRLANELMRPSNPANGEPVFPRMVPDKPGRAAVMGIGTLIEAVKGDEGYAAFDKFYTLIVTAPIGFITAPGAAAWAGMSTAARAGYMAVRGVQIASEVANVAMVYGDMDRWRSASGQAEVARGASPVIGVEAYNEMRSEARDAAFSAAFGGGLTVGVPLFVKAAQWGLRPSRAALDLAVSEAARRGVGRLGPETRKTFEFMRGRAEYRAAKYGIESLTDTEKLALRTAYPNGFPGDVAARFKVPGGDKTWTVLPDDPAHPRPVDASSFNPIDELSPQAERAALSDSDELTIDVSDLMPENSSNTALRQAYRDADSAARAGDAAALARRDSLARAADEWASMNPARQGRTQEAFEILQRLKKKYPQLAKLDDAQVMESLMFQSLRDAGGNVPISPEEMASIVTSWNRVKVDPADLGRAANVSDLNAAAALKKADDLMKHFDNKPGMTKPPTPAERAAMARAETMTVGEAPPAALANAAEDSGTFIDAAMREKQIADRLREAGIDPRNAALQAAVPARKPGLSLDAASAGAGFQTKASPAQLMKVLKCDEPKLRKLLDEYFASVYFEPNAARRQKWVDDFIKGDATTIIDFKPAPPPPYRPPGPPGIDPPRPPAAAAREEVLNHLEDMGIDANAASRLDIDKLVRETGDPRVAAAGAARTLDVDPSRIRGTLGADQKELTTLLDRFAESTRPGRSSAQRSEEIINYLGQSGDARPLDTLADARNARVERALGDLGVRPSRPDLVTSGLDVESSIVGNALEGGVRPATLMSRRNLSPERLRRHLDEYLQYGRGISDAAKREQLANEFFAGRNIGESARWQAPSSAAPVIGTGDDVAEALLRMNVDPAVARTRAATVAESAQRDAYQAIVGAAAESKVAPQTLKETFGLTDAQIAAKLDAHLRETVGITDPARRARMIGEYLPEASRQPGGMSGAIAGARPVDAPLRPVSTATPETAPIRRPEIHRPRVVELKPDPTPQKLDELYGASADPLYIKPFERASDGKVLRNPKLMSVGDKPWITYPNGKYIWAIDDQGKLLLGYETPVGVTPSGEALRLGHPTLTGGGKARISGELRFDPVQGQWIINNQSGRYSVRIGEGALRPEHLENVARRFEEAGLPVMPVFN